MNEDASAERELATLADLVAGDLAMDDARAQALLARDPSLRARIEDLREAAVVLGGAAELRREILAAARNLTGTPGETEILRILKDCARPRALRSNGVAHAPSERALHAVQTAAEPALVRRAVPARRPGARVRVIGVIAVCAAAGVVAVLWLGGWVGKPQRGQGGGGGADAELHLGGESQIGALAPTGTVDGPLVFSWSSEAPASGELSFRVRVFDSAGAAIDSSPDVREPRWTPPVARVASWPRSFSWEVELVQGGVRIARSARVPVERTAGPVAPGPGGRG